MTYSVIDFLSDQLKAAAPAAEWDASGVDRARELAQMLHRAGINDLSILELIEVERKLKREAWTPVETLKLYSLRYKERLIGFLGTPDRRDTDTVLGDSGNDFAVAWSAEGKGHVMYMVTPAPGGFAVVPSWGSSSDWGTFRQIVVIAGSFVLLFALPVAGFAVATSLGTAIVGPTLATSYPLLANVVGSVALSTAFNGGDVEKAVKGAALSMVGLEIGSAVGAGASAVTDVALIGKIADAATQSFIVGGDVRQSVAVTLIKNGGSIMDFGDFNSATEMPGFDVPTFDAPAFNAPAFEFTASTSPLDPFAFSAQPGFDQGLTFTAAPDFSGFNVPEVRIEPPRPASVDDRWFTKDTVNTVSAAALSALQLVKAYRNLDAPAVLTQARAQTNAGAVSALDTGVIQTRGPDGRIVNTRPPAGVAQSTVSGNVMVNNGDGTYTLIDRAGNRRVIQYGSESPAGFDLSSVPVAAWLAGAGLLVAVLKRG